MFISFNVCGGTTCARCIKNRDVNREGGAKAHPRKSLVSALAGANPHLRLHPLGGWRVSRWRPGGRGGAGGSRPSKRQCVRGRGRALSWGWKGCGRWLEGGGPCDGEEGPRSAGGGAPHMCGGGQRKGWRRAHRGGRGAAASSRVATFVWERKRLRRWMAARGSSSE